LYIVMRCLDGRRSEDAHEQQQRLSLRDAAASARQVSTALGQRTSTASSTAT